MQQRHYYPTQNGSYAHAKKAVKKQLSDGGRKVKSVFAETNQRERTDYYGGRIQRAAHQIIQIIAAYKRI